MDKEDYLLAMERSPIKDVEIKVLLHGALTDAVESREVFMKGIDHSYYYEAIPHSKQSCCERSTPAGVLLFSVSKKASQICCLSSK